MTKRSPDDVRAAVAAALARYPLVAAAWVFGSCARGDARPSSDLDVAVLPRRALTTDELLDLYGLAAALERVSPSGRVDVLVLGKQGPVVRHRVLREGLLVHDADPAQRIAFESRTIAEYLDWRPTHELAMQGALAGLRARFARRPTP